MENESNEKMEIMSIGDIGKNKPKENKKLSIIKKIITALLVTYFILKFSFNDFIVTYDEEATQMYVYHSRYYLKKETINHFNEYINICLNGTLIDNNVYSLPSQPKITVIIPIYKGGKYLYYSLRSIQNQKLKEIEILLIDDCSPDDSVQIIEKYMKEDPRIRLIKNEKNRNILYSKSMAALNAKGKYILELDQDDMFISDDAFETLYNLAESKNLDLIQFKDFLSRKFYVPKAYEDWMHQSGSWINSNDSKDNLYKTQPELRFLFFNNYNFLLWGLLIKTEIYKKVITHIWPIIINYRLALFEDFEITFFLLIFAKNFQFINYFFIIHLFHPNAVTFSYLTTKEDYLSQLFVSNNMMNYYLDDHPEDIHIMVNYIRTMTVIIDTKEPLYPDFNKYIIRKIMANNYLTYEEKEQILKRYHLTKQGYKIWNTYEYFMPSSKYNMIFSYQQMINQNKNKLIKNIPLKPRFSIIVYCNEYKYLENVINSIEYQNFDDYEIILIYDNNNITESNSIEEFAELYNNIKLINNMEEKGRFYSFTKGILESKGEYILTIKPGYTLATETVLSELNNNVYDSDIIEFNLLTNSEETVKNNTLDLYKCFLHFKSEINLDLIKANKRVRPIDLKKELIENKLIKSDIYKSIINDYKSIFEDNVVYNYYDEIFMYLINKKGIKINHINNIGMIQYRNVVKLFEEKNQEQKINDTIFYINFLFEHSDNTIEGKRYAIYEFYDHLNIIFNRYNKIPEEAKELVNKFLNCIFISQYKKNNLNFYYRSLTSDIK
jgi:glycosyltransferase involved in cell wall biosynthesis